METFSICGNSHEKSHELVICAGNTKLEQENDVNKDQQIEGNRISIGQRIAHMEDTRNEHCLKPELRQQKLVTYTCQICNLHTNSKAQLDIHKKGRKHMSMLQKNGGSDRNSGGKSHKSVELTGNEQQIRREGNSNVPEAAVLEELENSRSQKPKLSEQKAKYWCKMCDVGTNSEEHMNDHRKGKEHMTLLRKNGGAVIVVANKLQM
ncbi:hypothetical protein Nepgr_009842 [Nepenthes gracilis]|uniref:C2H2-type domain-containing protein n=1 Tax=Nepenthes gracilis TaxID=150966 RepID=A0AAD3SBH6_NEPGR|nr:hypothetical protein Nepgr_009842 [Nepenthes gracilis]